MRVRQGNNQKTKILIIGLGNPLSGDDGFGCHVIKILQSQSLPYGVQALEGGTDALALLPELQNAEYVILLDIVQTGGVAGTVYQIPLSCLPTNRDNISQHQLSLLHLYQSPAMRYELSLPRGVLLAVEVEEVELFSEKLSLAIVTKIPRIVERVKQLIENI